MFLTFEFVDKIFMARPFKWSRLNSAFKWYYKFFSILQNKICNFDQFWLQPFLRVEGLSPIHQKVLMKWLIYKNIKFFVNDILRKLKWKKKSRTSTPLKSWIFFRLLYSIAQIAFTATIISSLSLSSLVIKTQLNS